MDDQTAPAWVPQAPTEAQATTVSPVVEILRDIVRGGVAGLVVGVLVAGVGSRLAMRLAALAVPSAHGSFTENGNRIGDITLGGSLGLIVLGALLATIFLATIWVSISPWLPGSGVIKGIVAIPIALAFGSIGVIEDGNPDFVVLQHDPIVVAILLIFVASTAPAMAIADTWLDRRLPHVTRDPSRLANTYAGLTVVGATLGCLLMLPAPLNEETRAMGITVIAVGVITLLWWRQRSAGRTMPPRSFTVAARAILIVGTIAGFASVIPEVRGVLGLSS